MSNEPTNKVTPTEPSGQPSQKADHSTRWAADRTLWAADRTFIAWLRTTISMIGFGFSIGKAGDILEGQGIVLDNYNSTAVIGVAFISLGVLGLIGALIQVIRIDRRLEREGYGRVEPTPLGQVMGFLVLGVGVVGAVYIFI
jgi:inner membrane protein YidH